ncbi:hypothetical protein [Nocardia sp. 348MFTsu5.1]|uniref:hypothetical protein n=1 Tax=Nocardia sp. 348MFTsu5.1 TaxID=1172185 RepID=UPI00036C40AF|nr:hypothetical protein [Nocardia sp. 348MFTsu5.1]
MVTVAGIDRWNSEQVREVFHRTREQILACDTMVTEFTNLSVFETWSGDTATAAKESISGTIQDFAKHMEEAASIGNAAQLAADDIDKAKASLASIRADAERLSSTISPEGRVDGPLPADWDNWDESERSEYRSAKIALQERLDNLLTDAEHIDEDLAAAIDGADGDLPVTDVDPLYGTSSITRRANQVKAFQDQFDREPKSPNDWSMAEMLDTNTYDPVYRGVNSEVVVKKIDKVPGGGLQRINAFIPRDSVNNIPHQNRGDNRGFDPKAGPEDSRVSIYVDYDNGVIVMRQNPSVEIPSGAVKVDEPTFGVAQDGERVQVTFEATDPYAPFDDQKVGEWGASTVGATVRGTLITSPLDGAPEVEGQLTNYPAWEVYDDSNSGTTTPMYQYMPDASDPWGPARHLPGHHKVP